MKKNILILILIFFIFSCFSQTKNENRVGTSVNSAYILGGKITHKTMVFRSGINFDFDVNKKIFNQLSLGIGTGAIFLEDEIFIPFYTVIKIPFKENLPAYFFSFKLGYSYGQNYKINPYIYYDYKGGLFINPSFGYQIQMNELIKFNVAVKIINQFGMLKYVNEYNNKSYSERIRLLLLGFNFGFEF